MALDIGTLYERLKVRHIWLVKFKYKIMFVMLYLSCSLTFHFMEINPLQKINNLVHFHGNSRVEPDNSFTQNIESVSRKGFEKSTLNICNIEGVSSKN